MKMGRFFSFIAVLVLLSVPTVWAETAEDCIAEYENMKAQFELAAPGASLDCVKTGSLISLDTEGALPVGCSGSWDHWHLEAKAGVGKDNRSCSMMLRGLEGQEGCGTTEVSFELPANDAAAWRNYLRDECDS